MLRAAGDCANGLARNARFADADADADVDVDFDLRMDAPRSRLATGTVAGVTEFDAAEAGPVPTALVVITEKA